ncbi:uncharacterized protein LOC126736158 [Anthonomus grandis grandis]|uniref:uncharacterized protein LOC126736158 n=1 Tax=Anthonomus grandis grandis TaxID=2921223 RepID=UPI002165962B|nr:uncharacterized protein LOC126736158 [Anthonomus grandis grandis]
MAAVNENSCVPAFYSEKDKERVNSAMSETEKLIELVRERRLLYDLSNNDYKNREKKSEAWAEIAREMGIKDGKHWSIKWKNLKDNYNKFQKNTQTQSGQGYKKYKNWPWADLMRFLDNFKFRRITETNTICQSKETNRDDSQSLIIEDLNSIHSESEVREVSPETNTPRAANKKKAKNTTPDSSDKLRSKF